MTPNPSHPTSIGNCSQVHQNFVLVKKKSFNGAIEVNESDEDDGVRSKDSGVTLTSCCGKNDGGTGVTSQGVEKKSLDLYIKEGRDRFRLLDKENEKDKLRKFEKEIDVEIENGFKNNFFCSEGLFCTDPAGQKDIKGLGETKMSATFNDGPPRPSHSKNLASLTRKMKSESYSEKLFE